MAGWYIRRGDSVIGPADVAKLKELAGSGKLLRSDELAKDAAGPWTQASRTELFTPPAGANAVMPPPLPIARGAIPPAPPVQSEQDQQAGVGKVATMARTSKAIVVTVGQSALAAGGAVSRAISTGSQRRHELKLAKIHANALATGQRPAEVNVRMTTGTSGFGVAALVLGIIACLTCWIPFIGLLVIPIAALGLFFGFIGLCVSIIGRRSGVGMPVAGAVVCATALYIAIGTTGAVVSAIGSAADAGRPTPAAPNQASQQKPAPTISGPSSPPVLPIPASPTIPPAGAAPAETAHAPPPDGPIWTDAHQPVQLGDVRVYVGLVRVGIVPLVGFAGDGGESKDELLMVALTVENTSTTRKIDYRGFAADYFGLGGVARLEDNHENSYRRVGFGYVNYPKGQIHAAESIYPGKALADLLVFEVPIDKAAYLRLELPASAVGADEDAKLRFQIPASMIGGHTAANEQHAKEQAAAEEARINALRARNEAKWHTWTIDGQHTFEAKYLSAEGGTVKLEKGDGTIIKIQMDQLSDDDHKWIIHDGWKRPPIPSNSANSDPRWRTWTTDGGKRTFDAKYLSAERSSSTPWTLYGGSVKLERADGTIIKIQYDDLSDDDRKWIITPPGEPAPVAKPSNAVRPTTDANGDPKFRLGQSLTLDQLNVTPYKVELKRVTSASSGDTTKEPVLALTVTVENVSKGQVFTPFANEVKGKDNFGNKLEEPEHNFVAEGSAVLKELKPGGIATIILCLKPRIDTATSYRWEIAQICGNDEVRHWVLEFNADEISH